MSFDPLSQLKAAKPAPPAVNAVQNTVHNSGQKSAATGSLFDPDDPFMKQLTGTPVKSPPVKTDPFDDPTFGLGNLKTQSGSPSGGLGNLKSQAGGFQSGGLASGGLPGGGLAGGGLRGGQSTSQQPTQAKPSSVLTSDSLFGTPASSNLLSASNLSNTKSMAGSGSSNPGIAKVDDIFSDPIFNFDLGNTPATTNVMGNSTTNVMGNSNPTLKPNVTTKLPSTSNPLFAQQTPKLESNAPLFGKDFKSDFATDFTTDFARPPPPPPPGQVSTNPPSGNPLFGGQQRIGGGPAPPSTDLGLGFLDDIPPPQNYASNMPGSNMAGGAGQSTLGECPPGKPVKPKKNNLFGAVSSFANAVVKRGDKLFDSYAADTKHGGGGSGGRSDNPLFAKVQAAANGLPNSSTEPLGGGAAGNAAGNFSDNVAGMNMKNDQKTLKDYSKNFPLSSAGSAMNSVMKHTGFNKHAGDIGGHIVGAIFGEPEQKPKMDVDPSMVNCNHATGERFELPACYNFWKIIPNNPTDDPMLSPRFQADPRGSGVITTNLQTGAQQGGLQQVETILTESFPGREGLVPGENVLVDDAFNDRNRGLKMAIPFVFPRSYPVVKLTVTNYRLFLQLEVEKKRCFTGAGYDETDAAEADRYSIRTWLEKTNLLSIPWGSVKDLKQWEHSAYRDAAKEIGSIFTAGLGMIDSVENSGFSKGNLNVSDGGCWKVSCKDTRAFFLEDLPNTHAQRLQESFFKFGNAAYGINAIFAFAHYNGLQSIGSGRGVNKTSSNSPFKADPFKTDPSKTDEMTKETGFGFELLQEDYIGNNNSGVSPTAGAPLFPPTSPTATNPNAALNTNSTNSSTNSNLVKPLSLQTEMTYDALQEYARLGIDMSDSNKSPWRLTKCNRTYQICDSYPQYLVVPKRLSDADLGEVAKYRRKGRVPSLSWCGGPELNFAGVYRCSQPMVGPFHSTSSADEKMLRLIAEACSTPNISATGTQQGRPLLNENDDPVNPLFVMDLRSSTAALGNMAGGGGYEQYGFCEIEFAGIPNIHAVKSSFDAMEKAIAGISYNSSGNWYADVGASQWYETMALILQGAANIAWKIRQKRACLIHCSDGWDRTAQNTTLVMLSLDPAYRTLKGFCLLIQKEWCSFGHRFRTRLATSEKATSEYSPVFLQWLECVYQLLHQHPFDFEFNSGLLLDLVELLFSNKYGNFLADNECEYGTKYRTNTVSVFTEIITNKEKYLNPKYRWKQYTSPVKNVDETKASGQNAVANAGQIVDATPGQNADTNAGQKSLPRVKYLPIVFTQARLKMWNEFWFKYHPHMWSVASNDV